MKSHRQSLILVYLQIFQHLLSFCLINLLLLQLLLVPILQLSFFPQLVLLRLSSQCHRLSKLLLSLVLVHQVLLLVRLLILCIVHYKLLLLLVLYLLERLVSMDFLHLGHKFCRLLFLLLIMLLLQLVG